MVDLATLFNDDNDRDKVDLSGKKIPKNIRAVLDSGFEIQCDTRYDGQATDNPLMRRYLVIAEIDWSKHWVKTLLVEELPLDVRLCLRVPDTTSSEHKHYAAQMKTWIARRV